MDTRLIGIPKIVQIKYYYSLSKDVDVKYRTECNKCGKQAHTLYNNVKVGIGFACINCLDSSPIGKYNINERDFD